MSSDKKMGSGKKGKTKNHSSGDRSSKQSQNRNRSSQKDQRSSNNNQRKFQNNNSNGRPHHKKHNSEPSKNHSHASSQSKQTEKDSTEPQNKKNNSIVEYRTPRAREYAERQQTPHHDTSAKNKTKNETFHPVIDPKKHGRAKKQYIKHLKPTAWSSKGEGIFLDEIKVEGRFARSRRTLVWGGIPNETAQVSLLEGKNQNYAWFQLAQNPSPFRREPVCELYTKCGGCSLMHVSAEGQQQAKLEILRNHLEKTDTRNYSEEEIHQEEMFREQIVQKLPTQIHMIDHNMLGYRHVVKLVAGTTEMGNFRLGMRNAQGYIVPVPQCHVTTPLLRKQIALVAHLCTEMKIFPYDSESKKGLRYVVIRQSKYKKQSHVTFVVALGPPESRSTIPMSSSIWAKLAEELTLRDGTITGTWIHLNDSEGNRIFESDQNGSIHAQSLSINTPLIETVNGLEYEVGVGDFFQVNVDMAADLQKRVVEVSRDYAAYPMVDLYCGVGFFTLALAKEHGFALGIEGVRTAIERAQINANRNHISARFKAEWAIDLSYTVQNEIGEHHPFLVVDPARRGLEDGVFEEIVEIKPVAVLYISCGPRGLHQDIRMFLKEGWKIEFMEAYDMFPQTPHVETLTLLVPPYTIPESTWRIPTRKTV